MDTVLEREKRKTRSNGRRQPAWDVALGFPMQGDWTEDDYLAFEANFGNRMVELANGCLEVLPTPSLKHQRIARWMANEMDAFILPRELREVAMASSRTATSRPRSCSRGSRSRPARCSRRGKGNRP
jgi:Uma2 family endonuclease